MSAAEHAAGSDEPRRVTGSDEPRRVTGSDEPRRVTGAGGRARAGHPADIAAAEASGGAGMAGASEAGQAGTVAGGGGAGTGDGSFADRYRELVEGWAADTELLLAERAQRRGDGTVHVGLPRRLAVSSLVTMARDPGELARQVRRPMPGPPAPRAQRGTAFHRWLEERFGQQQLIDTDDLLGAADDAGADDDTDLAELKAAFDVGEWADRWPREVEVPFETLIGDRLVRGRIDAVFADAPQGGFDVVDWKTGRPPRSAAEERAAAVQLAAYRLAWAALAGVPVHEVSAAFYYVRADQTVRPADLLGEDRLAALI
jgi:DNA helicase II / ATP-dependent DNA helicase PcrA